MLTMLNCKNEKDNVIIGNNKKKYQLKDIKKFVLEKNFNKQIALGEIIT